MWPGLNRGEIVFCRNDSACQAKNGLGNLWIYLEACCVCTAGKGCGVDRESGLPRSLWISVVAVRAI